MGNVKEILISAAALTVIAGGVTAALAGTNALTEGTIAAMNEKAETAARQQVIDADAFERKTVDVDGKETVYYEAQKGGDTVGYVFTATATGKSAGLVVMTGIGIDGRITGVTVTDDNETAGYVDKVKKGGLFDAFSGKDAGGALALGTDVDGVSQATKTSKGVTDGVNQAIAAFTEIKGAGTNG